MQILTVARPGRASRWLGAAYLTFAAAVTVPSAAATAGPMPDAGLTVQDEGQREQIEQLRRALAELRQQHAELSRQLERIQAGKAKESDHDAEDDKGETRARVFTSDGDGPFRAWRGDRTLLPGTRVYRNRNAKPEAEGDDDAEPKSKASGKNRAKKPSARAFAWRDGEMQEIEWPTTFDWVENGGEWQGLLDHAGVWTFDGKDDGAWKALKAPGGAWSLLRGDGSDANSFLLHGKDGAQFYRVDSGGEGRAFWVDTDGELKEFEGKIEGLPGGVHHLFAPRTRKVEKDGDVDDYRVDVDSGDTTEKSGERRKGDGQAPAKVRSAARAKKGTSV